MQTATRKIRMDNRTVSIRTLGSSNPHPIVYFNHVPDIPGEGLALCEELSRDHQVYYVEGLESEASIADNTYANLTRLAVKIVQSLELSEPPLLSGHLSGGHIAAEIARLHPELAKGVYLIHTPIDVLTSDDERFIEQTQLYWGFIQPFVANDTLKKKLEAMQLFWERESWWSEKKDAYEPYIRDETFLKKATYYFQANFSWEDGKVRSKEAPVTQKITLPSLFIYDHKRITSDLIDHDTLQKYVTNHRIYPFSLKSLKPWLTNEQDLNVIKSIKTFYKDTIVAADLSKHEQRIRITKEAPPSNQPLRVCVVGAGAAGLSSALALREAGHEVTVIEKQAIAGTSPGHASSVVLPGGASVDPAFGAIIPALYPNMIQLLDRLNVSYDTLSYANRSATYFTQNRDLTWDGEASYPFSRKIFLESDKLRSILQLAEKNHGDYLSLEDILNESDHQFSMNFWHHYFFGRMIFFFGGHRLRYYLQYPLSILNLTANLDLSSNKICRITKGSGHYMKQFQAFVEAKGVNVITGATGKLTERAEDGTSLSVHIQRGDESFSENFDHVVLGILPDESLRFMGDLASQKEANILSSFSISDDTVILHTDDSFMPKDHSMWRYMNVMVPSLDAKGYDQPCVATKLFYSNHDQKTPTFVTHAYGVDLPIKGGVPSTHRHVHINVDTVRLRKQVESIQGNDGIWYCGSWLRGLNFHEDAIVSGLKVAANLTGNKELATFTSPSTSEKEEKQPITTFADVLKLKAATYQQRNAFVFLDDKGNESQHQTFLQLYKEAGDFGYHLITELKLKKGDHVVLCYLNASDHYIAFLGCMLAGIIPAIITPLNPKKVKAEIDVFGKVIESCGAKVVLTDSKYYTYYKAGRAASPQTYGKKIDVSWYRSDKFKSKKPDTFAFDAIHENDTAYLQYTSGSIGVPKGILITHAQLLAQLDMLEDRLRPTPKDVVVSWVPHFHNIGLVGIFLLNIYAGATTVTISPLVFLANPKIYLDALSFYRAAFTVMPSFGLKHILKKIGPFESTTWNLSRLKTLALGGERIDPAIMESFVATFKKTGLEVGVMAPGYGLGEHVTIVSLGGRRFYHADRMALTHQNKIKPGTHTLVGCGEPVKGVDVRIVHPDTCMEVSSDQVGEIWVTSACKATGYIHQEEQNKEVFYAQLKGDDASESYLRTGDLGFIKEGELFVCGRIKNMINVRGTNFYPIDIEEALVSIPSVSGCIAFPHLSEEEEEGIAIAVEINASENIKTEDQMNGLIQEVSEKTLMNVGVAPETIVLLREGTLPRTSLGKLQRKEFQSTWEKGKVKPLYISKEEASPDHHQLIDLNELEVLDFSSVEKVIIRKIKEVARVWVDPNVSLFDQIALESIQVVQLVNELSRTFNIDLSLTILEMCDTVEDIAEYIHNAPEYQPLPANVVAFNQEKKQEDTPPIFLVHPARGGVHCYLELAREMDDMFYAISDDGNYTSVEEKASAYCELIRQVQPVGPYTLGGYSFGGTLSLAMASLLERAGEDVRQVILIDEGHASNADFPDAFNESIDVSEFLEVIASDYLMAQEIDQLKASHKKGATLSEICQQISDPKIRELVLFEKEAYVSNIRLLKKWTPDFTYSGPVTLLKTKNLINHLEKRYTNVVPIPGNHLSIIRQPLVKEVSHLVTELLHESEQKVEEKLGVMG